MEFVNYYELLGIEKSASEDEIRKAIRTVRKRFRQLEGSPDLDQRTMAEKKIAQIAEAEKTLTDATVRQQYDASFDQNAAAANRQQASQSTQQSQGDLLEDAREYYLNGQLRLASYAVKEVTQTQHDNPDAWYLRAQISSDAGDYGDANFSVNQALRFVPNEPKLYGLMGEIADKEGRYSDAETAFRKAAVLDPQRSYYVGRVAGALMDQQKTEESLKTIREAEKTFQNDGYIKFAHVTLLLIYISWIESNNSSATAFWFANAKQVAKGKEILAEIDSIGFSDDTKEDVEKLRKDLEYAGKRHFHWSGLGLYAGIFILWVILIGIFSQNALVALIITVALGAFLYFKSFPYGWQINVSQYGENKTGLQ
uniref:tetratricopeptide repeat protein n=1 Tax=Bifidobacterium adolescentis TaxID=1680 RepID=UPI00359C67C5